MNADPAIRQLLVRALAWAADNYGRRMLQFVETDADQFLTGLPDDPAADNLEACARAKILAVLEKCQGNKQEAAKRLGISRPTLYRRLQQMERENNAN